ncbi:hypothetical protein J4447_01025 [Candidatus Pacearchaeota archaeon]|nr:hypothetical protein [Candidatus Pacearchaeota archaeon]
MVVEEHIDGLAVKRMKISKELARSLIETSKSNEETVNNLLRIKNNPLPPVFVLAYDSLRMILEALCAVKGYKVGSHIQLGELVKEFYREFDYNTFDRVRWVRNSIQYYGQDIDSGQGKELISKMLALKREMLAILEEELKR